jgi:hypothetical protein
MVLQYMMFLLEYTSSDEAYFSVLTSTLLYSVDVERNNNGQCCVVFYQPLLLK